MPNINNNKEKKEKCDYHVIGHNKIIVSVCCFLFVSFYIDKLTHKFFNRKFLDIGEKKSSFIIKNVP